MKNYSLFLSIVFAGLFPAQSSTAAGHAADVAADKITNAFRAGKPVSQETVRQMFSALKDADSSHEAKSDERRESDDSAGSCSSTELIDGTEVVLEAAHYNKKSIKAFADLLREVAPSIDPNIFPQGLELILEKLRC